MFSNSSYRAIRNIVLLSSCMTVILLLYIIAAISIGLFATSTPHIPTIFLNWANISILFLVCIMLRYTKPASQQSKRKSIAHMPLPSPATHTTPTHTPKTPNTSAEEDYPKHQIQLPIETEK